MRHGSQGLQNTRFPEKVILTVLEINFCNGVRRVHAADHKRALSGPAQRHTRALETHKIAFEAFRVTSHTEFRQAARTERFGRRRSLPSNQARSTLVTHIAHAFHLGSLSEKCTPQMSEDPRDTSNLYSPSSSHRGETNNSTLELFRLAFHLYLTLR
ncbi:rh52 [macacine betaherpesvirus 3]|uniref:Rh52 n=1 Tax=Rhesus cytomegalovirus (strain 68-1) TaxID=47929 RepID=Q7TFS9_RHCM6|nr:rh52 [macacine betaherpesvirus 3]AAP50579.1 rh52 [macacine betaherpesvirus 3]AAZ80549.1 rh52 [macacine betaherpesvirus 3]